MMSKKPKNLENSNPRTLMNTKYDLYFFLRTPPFPKVGPGLIPGDFSSYSTVEEVLRILIFSTSQKQKSKVRKNRRKIEKSRTKLN